MLLTERMVEIMKGIWSTCSSLCVPRIPFVRPQPVDRPELDPVGERDQPGGLERSRHRSLQSRHSQRAIATTAAPTATTVSAGRARLAQPLEQAAAAPRQLVSAHAVFLGAADAGNGAAWCDGCDAQVRTSQGEVQPDGESSKLLSPIERTITKPSDGLLHSKTARSGGRRGCRTHALLA